MGKKIDPKKMVERLKKSPAYRIAYYDNDFMDEDFCRPVRLQLELLKPEELFAEQGILSTVVVFGGTRIVEPSEAKAAVKKVLASFRLKAKLNVLSRPACPAVSSAATSPPSM